MASYYFHNQGGNWTDTTKWAASDASALLNINDGATPTASDDVFLTANSGQCTISAASVGKSLNCTGYTGTLTHNAFTLTLSGSATFVSGMTYPNVSSTSGALSFNASATLTTGGKRMKAILTSGTMTLTVGDNLTFLDAKTASLSIGTSTTFNQNGFAIAGDSSVNRLLIQTSVLGTQRTITNMTTSFSNVDFRDIAPASGSVDLSAITGLSGDCGGNTNITFTTAATQTYTGGTDSWSTAARWTSRVPLPQDNVSMAGVTGGTITADMPRLGKSIDWTGASGSPTFTNSIATTSYGSITQISAMTATWSNTHTLEGRSSFAITSAGKSFGNLTQAAFGGTYTLQDALTSTAVLTVANGTFDTGSFNVTLSTQFTFTGSALRQVNFGSSTINPGASGNIWNIGGSNLTVNAGTSTIVFTDTGAGSKTFTGASQTYNNLSISGGGAGAVIITGANTFNRIYTNGGGTKSITLPGSTTTTIVSGQGLNNGTNVITFTASAGSATVAKSGGGIVDWKSVNLTNIIASAADTWYAGTAPPSVDGGGNTNWIFLDAPNAAGSRKIALAGLWWDEEE